MLKYEIRETKTGKTVARYAVTASRTMEEVKLSATKRKDELNAQAGHSKYMAIPVGNAGQSLLP